MPKPPPPPRRIVNKKARLNYEIIDTIEAGIALMGPEVKSLRAGSASLDDAFARVDRQGVVLVNLQIDPYKQATTVVIAAKRARRLLLKRREIKRLETKTAIRGQTLIPLSLYFNEKGLAKVELALARGKTHGDKRQSLKVKEAKRDIERDAGRHRR